LLLKALQLVSRYRFMFLEDQSEFHYVNIALADPLLLPDLARRIVSELDLLTSDMYLADLQLPATWGQFVSLDAVQEMHGVWKPLDDELRRCCDAIVLSAGDNSGHALDDEQTDEKKRETFLRKRADLADILKQCREMLLPYNTQLLAAMARKLVEVAGNGEVVTASEPSDPLGKPSQDLSPELVPA